MCDFLLIPWICFKEWYHAELVVRSQVKGYGMKRQFIAGARCPKCQSLDALALVSTSDSSYVECVDCGYVQHEPKGGSGTPGLIASFDPNQD